MNFCDHVVLLPVVIFFTALHQNGRQPVLLAGYTLSATRNFALLARGFALTSCSPGPTGLPVTTL
jgi:hypothetical protein